jgi:O-antigen ligase
MIRYTLLTGVVLGLLVYTWRDWYKGLCGVILLMAIYGRPDMPTRVFGVPGFNPFNLLLANVLLAWVAKRREERLRWDMPGHVMLLLLLYLSVVLIATFRMLADPRHLGMSTTNLSIEYVFNCLKWVIPGLLLFDGCRSRERFYWALFAVLGVYFLLALQCARQVSPTVSVSELERRSRKVLENMTGYNRVDLATMLAGAAWSIMAARELFRRSRYRLALLGAAGIVTYGLLLTAGRAGYAAFMLVGLVMCTLRWRKYLLVAPVALLVVVVAFPSVVGRVFEGINLEGVAMPGGHDGIDEGAVLAGRAAIWAVVVPRIEENPIIGYGRQAHLRLRLNEIAREVKLESGAGHPHNAYLELLLDSGILGFLPVMAYFMVVLLTAVTLFRDSRSPISIAAGGAGLAMTLAWLGGSIGAQTLYPRESTVGMWCGMMLMFRVSVERSRVLARERAARRDARRRLRAEPPRAAAEAPRPLGAYARRRRPPKRRWDAEVLAEPPTPLDGQFWARSA